MGKKTICRLCSEGCGLIVSQSKHHVSILPDPDHPISKGFICQKARMLAAYLYSNKRLTAPLVRHHGMWKTISWAESFSLIQQKFLDIAQKFGPESIVFYKGEGAKHQETTDYLRHFAYAFGSPNFITVDSLCHSVLSMAYSLTCGGIPYFDARHHRAVLMWGANMQTSHPRLYRDILVARKNLGTKLVTIDPVNTRVAQKSDLYLQIKPGTDGFLALALAKLFLHKNSAPDIGHGFDEYRTYVLSLDIDKLLEPTGLSFDQAEDAIHLLQESGPAWIHQGVGLEHQPHSFQTIRSISNLALLLDETAQGPKFSFPLKPLPDANNYPPLAQPIGAKSFPFFTQFFRCGHMLDVPKAIHEGIPYPVKAMLISAGNPAVSLPNTLAFTSGLGKLDFLVVHDLYMTATAHYADLVLPAASFLEFTELHDYGNMNQPYLALINPVVSTTHMSGKPLWEILFTLAKGLGLQQYFPWHNNYEAIMDRLGAAWNWHGPLEKDQCIMLDYRDQTIPAKSIKHFFVLDSPHTGLTAQPVVEALDIASLQEKYTEFPLRLLAGKRMLASHNTQLLDDAEVRLLPLEISQTDMDTFQVQDGETVKLATPWGNMSVQVQQSDVVPGTLVVAHGFTVHNINMLTPLEHGDPVTGFPWLKGIPARLEKSATL